MNDVTRTSKERFAGVMACDAEKLPVADRLRYWFDPPMQYDEGPDRAAVAALAAADEIERLQQETIKAALFVRACLAAVGRPHSQADLPIGSAVDLEELGLQIIGLIEEGKTTHEPEAGWRCECGEFMAPEYDNCAECLKDRPEQAPQALPEVGGNSLPVTLADFERGCKVHLAEEQAKLNPDNALIGLLCNAVRLARENERMAKSGIALPPCPEWRPMETAPRDQTPVLLLCGDAADTPLFKLHGIQFVGKWVSDASLWCFAAPVGYGGIPDDWLKGWMPLPYSTATKEGK